MKIKNTRRQFMRLLGITAPSLFMMQRLTAQIPDTMKPGIDPYPDSWLPNGIRSRFVENINGLRIHLLEAGHESGDRPVLVLLHGFPELAYSWRKIMLPLANSGYHVIAPDLRGYGRTTGWSSDYETDLTPFRMLNKVRDVMGLIYASGYDHVDCVVGHDFGSPLAAWCAVTRPDVFRSVVLMSAPFTGTPTIPTNTIGNLRTAIGERNIYDELENLPRPRKHYQRYYQTRDANRNMWKAEQGLSNFIRAY
jgi:pimeloyl-ACP methyl ester carboxylesterase